MLEMHLGTHRKGSGGYLIEELSNEQFISYSELSTLAGVNVGVLHNEGQGWLRFYYEGKELIVSKKSIRHSITWDQIHSRGCAFGESTITVLGNKYKVRLLKGADHNPTQIVSPGYGYHIEGSHESEWNRLFYPLVKDDSNIPPEIRNPIAPYSNRDLGVYSEYGSFSWCQETHQDNTTWRVLRGSSGVSYLQRIDSSNVHTNFGWRPCLELIPPTLLKPNLIDGFVVNTSGQYLTTPEYINGFAFTKND